MQASIKILTTLLSLLLSASMAQSFEQPSPVVIGLSLGLSGKYEKMSEMQYKGFLLWQAHVNEQGGLLGRPVSLLVKNDYSDPERAAQLYEKFIVKEHVDFLFAPYSSAVTSAVAPIAEKYGYPLLASGASAEDLWKRGYTYLFGLYTPAGRYTVGFLELMLRKNIKSLAIISADDPFSQSIAKGAETWAKRFGLTITLHQQFSKGKDDLTSLARNAKKSDCEIVLVCGHFNESVNMRKALQSIAWYPKGYYASVGPVLPDYASSLDSLSEKTFSSSQWESKSADKIPGGISFYKDFVKKFNKEPSYHAASAYSAGQILAKAVTMTRDFDRKKIRDVLRSLDTMTVIGRYGVDRFGKQIRHFPLIIQWQDGEKEVVWPKEFQTGQPIFH